MKKIIIAPDSFKGTLSAAAFCEIVGGVALRHFPGCEVIILPIADGGEGTVDCFLRCLPGERIKARAQNPLGEEIDSFYGFFGGMRPSHAEGATDNTQPFAVIEMAAAAGLPLIAGRENALAASTLGVGQLIMDAVERGAQKIIVGLGGSATTDGGCGMASACGVRFYDDGGNAFVPTGGTLRNIARIEHPGNAPLPPITAMCDIDNSMFGPSGAAHVFAPQKGATSAEVELLDGGLRHLAYIIKRDLGVDVSALRGAGAAGACGAGMAAFFSAELKPGIETVLDTAGFESHLSGADMVITGEGRFDSQSLGGKAVMGVAGRAMAKNVPVVVLAGGAEYIEEAYAQGVTAVFSINRLPEDFVTAKNKAAKNLFETADNIFRLLK
ncbi:MAG: glycerate kinase [Clostridia bacterium]|nr:glycerate kinase [Clostridia bacterium]